MPSAITTLYEWVQKGVVVPAVRGRRGRGRSHIFSARQPFGLAVAAALHRSERGCSPAYVTTVVRLFESFDDEELAGWLNPRRGSANPGCGFDEKLVRHLGPRQPKPALSEYDPDGGGGVRCVSPASSRWLVPTRRWNRTGRGRA